MCVRVSMCNFVCVCVYVACMVACLLACVCAPPSPHYNYAHTSQQRGRIPARASGNQLVAPPRLTAWRGVNIAGGHGAGGQQHVGRADRTLHVSERGWRAVGGSCGGEGGRISVACAGAQRRRGGL
jgi:hypothetical protein